MTGARVYVLAACMLVTGSINTIATKFQDITVTGVKPSGEPRMFQHPAIQSAFMFLGEFLCIIPFLLSFWFSRREGKESGLAGAFHNETPAHMLKTLFSFAVPALCDAAATTLLNVGLFYTYASIFQMLRGTLVVFAGFLTIVLLKRQLHSHHWLGIVLITAGAALVGASSVLYEPDVSPPSSPSFAPSVAPAGGYRRLLMLESTSRQLGSDNAQNPLFGDVLVVVAQLAAASQFIIEEKYLAKYRVPALLAVGLEGFWGLVICCVALPLLSIIKGPHGLPFDSVPQALAEIAASRQLQWSTAGSVVSIAFFNFFGISVTKSLSGAARATIDATRTLFIWAFSLAIGWEQFHFLQVIGFAVLLTGSSLYNELLRSCLPSSRRVPDDAEEPLLRRRRQRTPPPPGYAPTVPYPTGRREPSRAQSIYTLARSMRLFPTALSPHSLASTIPSGIPPSLPDSTYAMASMPSEVDLLANNPSPLPPGLLDGEPEMSNGHENVSRTPHNQ